MKRVSVSMVWITVGLTLLCLAGIPTKADAQKDTLVIGMADEPLSLDPAICYDVGWIILYNLYERLVTSDLSPQLAESWDLAADGRTWTIHLHKGATFASGNPVNADAVVFSLRRFVKLAGPASWVLTQFGITEDSVTKIDEEMVQIVLDQQYAPDLFLSCLLLLNILDPEMVLTHEQDDDLGNAWLYDHSAGSGPYVIEERQRGTRTVLKANEFYWGPKPAFEQVIIRPIGEPAERTALLQAGKLDIARNLLVEDIQMLESDPEVQILQTSDSMVSYLAMNLNYAPFTSPEVRDAMRYAIDYDGIIAYVLGGEAMKLQGFFPKGLLGYTPATPYSRNVDRARQLLAEGGYPEGFEVKLLCLDFSPWLELAMKLRDDLTGIGVMVHLVPVSYDQFEEAYSSRDFQLCLTGWYYDYPDPDANAKAFAHCDSAGDNATVKGPAWWSHYVNPETSNLVEQAARELDPEQRKILYEQITKIIVDDGPFVFLYTPIINYAVRTEVAPFIDEPEYIDTFPILK